MQEDQSLKSDDICDNEHRDASNKSLFDMGWHSSAGNSFYEAEERFLSFICCPSTLSLNVKKQICHAEIFFLFPSSVAVF